MLLEVQCVAKFILEQHILVYIEVSFNCAALCCRSTQSLLLHILTWPVSYSNRENCTRHWCITKRQSTFHQHLLMPIQTWATHWRRCKMYNLRCNAMPGLYRSIQPLLMLTATWPRFTRILGTYRKPSSHIEQHLSLSQTFQMLTVTWLIAYRYVICLLWAKFYIKFLYSNWMWIVVQNRLVVNMLACQHRLGFKAPQAKHLCDFCYICAPSELCYDEGLYHWED